MILWSLPLVPLGVAALFVPLQGYDGRVVALILAPVVSALAAAYLGARYARRIGTDDRQDASTANDAM